MNRTPQRRSTAVQSEAKSAPDAAAPIPPAQEPAQREGLSLGWRLCLLVWVLGFLALFAVELWGTAWKTAKVLFGGS